MLISLAKRASSNDTPSWIVKKVLLSSFASCPAVTEAAHWRAQSLAHPAEILGRSPGF
jgi:hypothetical protein